MKFRNKIFFTLLLASSLMIYSGPKCDFSHEEIFAWVANELEITTHYPMPTILIVPQEELQRIFKKDNEQSLKRWAGRYGDEEANKIMDQYLNKIIGLFDPKTNLIYVGNFMEPCKQQSIIAHELTHYFQAMEPRGIDPLSYYGDSNIIKFANEMEASNIENKFRETFCGTIDTY